MANSTQEAFRPMWTSLPRLLLLAAAVVFCAATTLYALSWMYDQRHPLPHPVEIGFNQSRDTFFDQRSKSIPVYNVTAGSPAEKAGLRGGDQITALNGHALTSYALFDKVWTRSRPGDAVEITVHRAGTGEPLTFRAIFRPVSADSVPEGAARASVREILNFYPIFFLLVGFAVLFLRLEDPHAWLVGLLFTGFVAVPNFASPVALPDALKVFASLYRTVFFSIITPLFYIFFALFPEKSPLERRAPWLKSVALAIGACLLFPGLSYGDAHLPSFVGRTIGENGEEYLRRTLTYGLLVLGIISLLWNCISQETSAEARRKSRVLLAGTLFGVLPFVIEHMLIDFFGYRPRFWIDESLNILVLLYPLSFAYAIVKHRVLEIPALLRRSARYVLVQRGYFLLLFCGALLAIFLFTRFFAGFFADHSQFGMALSAAFGVGLVWASGPFVKRGTDRIDRAFFRSSYDARMVLQDLAEKIRSVADRRELAALLEHHLTQAFHPQTLVIYFGGDNGELVATGRPVPAGLEVLDKEITLLLDMSLRGRTWDVPPVGDEERPENFPLAPLAPECLVPLVAHDARIMGLLVLGLPLSEEPYSREDKELLDSVAGQTAIALENMRLAEQIANRMEQDRRAAHEIEIARDVQSRLFPQVMPALKTLEYAGSCVQARQVGGDYYDFLDLGASHVAFVLADISGKGIAGALLMANLQANLRSRTAAALEDLPRLLRSANQLFYENTPEDRYATLFFAVYNDMTRELTYANCGHNPPLVLRVDGEVERLGSTATVIGLFPAWECTTKTIVLHPHDVLVIYTDGVTEANDAGGNEFGEARLQETVRKNLCRTPGELLGAIQEAVRKYSVGEQFDDLTLVVARGR
jgi:sigma-B regulation protein RsbU (phosphoserine phosphatase)